MTQDELYAKRRYHRDQITEIDHAIDNLAFEKFGVKLGQRVKYKTMELELCGVESILPGQERFRGWLVLKDGTVSRGMRFIYNIKEMKAL